MIALLTFPFRHWKIFLPIVLVLFGMLGYFAGPPIAEAMGANPGVALRPRSRPRILDRKGNTYLTLPEFGITSPTRIEEVPHDLKNAVLAREDKRFDRHSGWDVIATVRALERNITSPKSKMHGGSTITMQLVELSHDYPQKTFTDKLRAKFFEVAMAIRVEAEAERLMGSKQTGKDLIFTNYLDRIPFRSGQIGIKNAAHTYFRKSLDKLVLGEAGYLAALIRAPSKNDVYSNPENALAGRTATVQNMAKLEMIDPLSVDDALFFVLPRPARPTRRGDGFTAQNIRSEMNRLHAAGKLPFGGSDPLPTELAIHSTLDVGLQSELARHLKTHLDTVRPGGGAKGATSINGAIVVINNIDGSVLASVGGRSFDLLQLDLATSGRRPLSSCIKPFTLASLFTVREDLGIGSSYPNMPLNWTLLPGYEGTFSPREYLAPGPQSFQIGLAASSNRMALVTAAAVGHDRWTHDIQRLSLSSRVGQKNTAVLLGAGNTSPLMAAAAYSCLARGGEYIQPYFISKIADADRDIYVHERKPMRVFDRRACAEVTKGCREVLRSGTAASRGGTTLLRRFDVAGKSGTSGSSADAWFCGYGSHVTVAVWIGYPDSHRTISMGASGGTVAFPLWKTTMETLHRRGYPFHRLFPEDIRQARPALASEN